MPTITATPTSGTGKKTITVSSSLSYQRNDVTKTLRVNTNSGETATCTVVKKGVGLLPEGLFNRAVQDITADEQTINIKASDFGSGALCNSQTLYCKMVGPVVDQLDALTVEIRIIPNEGGATQSKTLKNGESFTLTPDIGATENWYNIEFKITIPPNFTTLMRPIVVYILNRPFEMEDKWGYVFLFRQRGARTPLSLSKSSMELTNPKPSDTVDVTTDDETTWTTSI